MVAALPLLTILQSRIASGCRVMVGSAEGGSVDGGVDI